MLGASKLDTMDRRADSFSSTITLTPGNSENADAPRNSIKLSTGRAHRRRLHELVGFGGTGLVETLRTPGENPGWEFVYTKGQAL